MKKFKVEKGMVKLDRIFANGDQVQLTLPMEIKLTTCGDKTQGYAIERGPLVYSLSIENKTTTFPYIGDPKLKDFPNKLMYPASEWSYALDIKDISEARFIENNADANYPWDLGAAPVKIVIPATKVKDWKLDGSKHAPIFPEQLDTVNDKEVITLVPLGAMYLRMTIFPKIN